ncbi:MAG: 6-phosphogluconolactonase [Bacteroidota bacterium]
MKKHVFETPQLVAEAFGDYLMTQLSKVDRYHCALSGGSTPKLLFSYLAKKYHDSPLWNRLHLYWGDERCVPPEHEDSNFKMTNQLLLSQVSIPVGNIHRIKGEEEPSNEAISYAEILIRSMPLDTNVPVFDLIILGLGEDGHTASIFPHQMELLDSKRFCEVATHPDSGQNRITLTGQVINAAKEVSFLVTGAGKADKVDEILEQKGDWKKYPASHIKPLSGNLNWYLDESAANHSL